MVCTKRIETVSTRLALGRASPRPSSSVSIRLDWSRTVRRAHNPTFLAEVDHHRVTFGAVIQRSRLRWPGRAYNAAYLPFGSGIVFGGCRGPQSPKSTPLTFEVDAV